MEWFSNVRADMLAGITVALALIPEAIAFSIIAGVDPMVGLYASFCIAVTIAFVGGRPGMISAATGAMALLMITLVKEHGIEYLFAATVLTGILQLVLGACKIGRLMTFVPHTGQSVINVKSGGRGRLSTLVAGIFLLFLILVLVDVVKQIPMAALVGVMVMVSIGTFNWQSIRDLRKIPVGDAVVMITTVIIVVATHDLAKGVISGVILSAVIFGWRMARLHATSYESDMGEKVYTVSGQLFFGTMTHFVDQFSFQDDPQQIFIDFSRSHVWDLSAVTAISKVVEKYRQLDKFVVITGLNDESKRLIDRVGISTPAGH
ncbi:SulP family inorganic anion transporter [Brevibacillus sp. RS1.1]|uniref:SulP family inorganic anion transporter n=1 Tax=Brevibacillus sp. RS1.1 TaxID=2738982 RepID=UPI00156AC9F6|nr:SulP family inorganic anion transporter [Brevibacillus sp. RS1.1]NRR02926.1 SulP family inorganic anion transporter [Brevibacillus sp. RS1.1]